MQQPRIFEASTANLELPLAFLVLIPLKHDYNLGFLN